LHGRGITGNAQSIRDGALAYRAYRSKYGQTDELFET